MFSTNEQAMLQVTKQTLVHYLLSLWVLTKKKKVEVYGKKDGKVVFSK